MRVDRTSVVLCILLCAIVFAPRAVLAHGSGLWDAGAEADSTAALLVSIDFEPPNGVRRADPAMYTSFDAYVVLEGANAGNLPGGLRTLTLRLGVTNGTSSPPEFESLLPKKLVLGGWREGIMMASAPCTADEHVVVGVLHLFYLGKPGAVRILDHPEFPRWVVDCENVDHRFRIGSHGGIHSDPPPVDTLEQPGGVSAPGTVMDAVPGADTGSHEGHDHE